MTDWSRTPPPITIDIETVVILGAGASAAVTRGQLPTDLTILKKCGSLIQSEHRMLQFALDCLFGTAWDSLSFEGVWSRIDDEYNVPLPRGWGLDEKQFYALFHELAEQERRQGGPFYYAARYPNLHNPAWKEMLIHAGWECRRLAHRIFAEINTDYDKTRYMKQIPGLVGSEHCAVISFNYDLLFDQSTELVGTYHYPFQDPKGILVLKPHGSVNWRHMIDIQTGQDNIEHFTGPLSLKDFGYKGKQLEQSLLIGLRPKHELEKKAVQDRAADLCQSILEACRAVLSRANHLIIAGYRFPEADSYFRETLSRAKACRSRPLRTLRFINKEQNKDDRAREQQQWEILLRHVFWVENVVIDLDGF